MERLVLPSRYSWIIWKNCLWTPRPRIIIATGRGKTDSEPWKSGCTVSRRGSYHLPFAKNGFERGFTRVRRSDGRGRWRQSVTRLIDQTFTLPKYSIRLVPRHVSTGEIRQEYFQERPLRRSFQKSKRSIRGQEFTASSFSLTGKMWYWS